MATIYQGFVYYQINFDNVQRLKYSCLSVNVLKTFIGMANEMNSFGFKFDSNVNLDSLIFQYRNIDRRLSELDMFKYFKLLKCCKVMIFSNETIKIVEICAIHSMQIADSNHFQFI